MAVERARAVRDPRDHGLLTRRLVALAVVTLAAVALGVPGVRAVSLELERRELVVERALLEAEAALLEGDLAEFERSVPER